MAMPIVPRIRRGRLYFPVTYAPSPVMPLTFAADAEVHPLDMIELINAGIVTPELTLVDGGV